MSNVLNFMSMMVLLASTPSITNVVALGNDNDLSRATWDVPAQDSIRDQVDLWLEAAGVADEITEQIREQWYKPVVMSERLSLLADSFALADQACQKFASPDREYQN